MYTEIQFAIQLIHDLKKSVEKHIMSRILVAKNLGFKELRSLIKN